MQFFLRMRSHPDFAPLERWSADLKANETLFNRRGKLAMVMVMVMVMAKWLCLVSSGGDDVPMVIVSSTSYTADEDFGVLLDALQLYDTRAKRSKLPRIVAIITGIEVHSIGD